MALIGLSHLVVPRVSNVDMQRPHLLWSSLILINAAVALGSASLMMGVNNGGGEYREYIWPIALLFALGVAASFIALWTTVARRTTRTIHVSSWYILSAHMFLIVITVVAYMPMWQDGIGETIIQGYYMHQGVGMWFMMCTLGLFYYFIPLATGREILSHPLGKVAFWSQIVFYTLIGTHHFIFSSIPWWLQVVAIIGSVGMAIPVIAGTINFLYCFRSGLRALLRITPALYLFVAVVYYFIGSLQGTAEAFQTTNLMWHFTDFSVAHSHMTMYGIITFALFGAIWMITREMEGRWKGAGAAMSWQFRLAFYGLLAYCIPLLIGGSMRGLSWMNGAPFIDSVTLMMPFWTWRAVGGSMMWISHLVFAFICIRSFKYATNH